MEIQFVNWTKFNPRKDVKRPSWFRMENNIVENPEFFDLTPTQFKTLVYLFCLSSKKDGRPFEINLTHAERVAQVTENDIEIVVALLVRIGTIKVTNTRPLRPRNVHGTSLPATNERTNEQDERTNKVLGNDGSSPDSGSKLPKTTFDLEQIYAAYPRKRKKGEGLKKLAKDIKTQADFDDCLKAAQNYTRDVANKEPQYKMAFSTFANNWRDWVALEPELGPETPISKNQWLWDEVRTEQNQPRNVGEGSGSES